MKLWWWGVDEQTAHHICQGGSHIAKYDTQLCFCPHMLPLEEKRGCGKKRKKECVCERDVAAEGSGREGEREGGKEEGRGEEKCVRERVWVTDVPFAVNERC